MGFDLSLVFVKNYMQKIGKSVPYSPSLNKHFHADKNIYESGT